MSFLSKNITVRPLEEELELLGLNTTPNQLATMASKRLDESFWDDSVHGALDENASGAAFGFEANDDQQVNSEVVTHELLDRIERVAESASEEELEAIFDALMEMEIDENDEELVERVTELAEVFKRIRKFEGGKIKMAKQKVLRGAEKLAAARKRRKGKAKRKAYDKKRRKDPKFKLRMKKRKRALAAKGMKESSFEDELRGLLGESEPVSAYQETVDRVERIMALIEQELPEAGGVMAEAFEALEENALICESEGDFGQAIVPCITLIKRCLEEIEAQDAGN